MNTPIERTRRGHVAQRLMAFFERLQRGDVENKSTASLDRDVRRYLQRCGMHSALVGYRGFPAHAAISPNAVAVHGLPDTRKIVRGDVFTLDVAARLGGWISDTAWTYLMPGTSQKTREQYRRSWRAFRALLISLHAGINLGDIAELCETTAAAEGLRPIPEFVGHGIGRELHEPPTVLFARTAAGLYDARPLTEGMIINIEPVYTGGAPQIAETGDGWSFRTVDGSATFHFELTVMIGAAGQGGGSSILQFARCRADELPAEVPFGDFSD